MKAEHGEKIGLVLLIMALGVSPAAWARPAPPSQNQIVAVVTRFLGNPASLAADLGHPAHSPKVLSVKEAPGSKIYPACTYHGGNGSYACGVWVTWQYPGRNPRISPNFWSLKRIGGHWRVLHTGWGHTVPMDVYTR